MTLRLNPLATHEHNTWTLPRIVFHLTHVAVGLPAAAVAWLLLNVLGVDHVVVAMVAVVLGTALSIVDKLTWLQWGAKMHVTIHWHDFHVQDWPDFWSDFLLTMLGALMYAWAFHGWRGWVSALIVLYVLGTFNGE
jgi:hypothetical protein